MDLIIISLKINLFSPWYSWKIAELALNSNQNHNHICSVILFVPCIMVCKSLFVLLSFFFWLLFCMSFFYLRLLITPDSLVDYPLMLFYMHIRVYSQTCYQITSIKLSTVWKGRLFQFHMNWPSFKTIYHGENILLFNKMIMNILEVYYY